MPRVVFDTNVWVSMLIAPGGACDELFRLALARQVELVTSSTLLEELGRVLRRKLDYSREETEQTLEFIRSVVSVVEPTERLRIIREKDADNRVLECAIAARADLIVSGDHRHLLPLKAVRGIPIQSPRIVLGVWS